VGAALGGLMLVRHLGAFVPMLTVVRVVAAAAAAIAVGRFLPMDAPLMALAETGVVGVVFLTVLVATGELGRADLGMVTRVLGRKKGAA
jgi:hypothetical protein